jgi:hypothetical protein
VNGTGNAAQPYSYSFVDRYPLNGINYYRLIQTDYEGKLTYSQIIAVTGPQLSNLSINIYPNPGNGQIWLTSSDVIEEMKISNLAGQIVYHGRSNEKNFSLQLDKTGVYFIQITTANQTITKKITVYR